MKIAVLTSSYPRYPGDGTAPFVKSMAENIVWLGHKVVVVAPYDPKVRRMESGGVQVHRFRYVIPQRYHIMGHAQAMEADVRIRPLSYLLLPLFMIFEFLQLLRVAIINKSEIIHVHWVLPNGPAAMLVSMILRIPYVLSLHGSDVYIAKKNKLFGLVAGWVFKRASAVTACSEDLKAAAISLGAPDRVTLIAWGADPDIFSPSKKSGVFLDSLGLDGKQPIISALGRMVYKKGFDILIEAWKDVSSKVPDAHLLIGGDGPLREDLIAMSDRITVADRITFVGNVNWEEVPEFLSSSDLFVIPSIRDKHGNIDGLPTVLLEAMACGVPVVASRLGGIPLVIADGKNGRLVPPGDATALSRALLELIQDAILRSALGKQARMDVVTKFNWSNVAKVFIELFEKALVCK
jgi:glycosyltransferase involved in cell wall biosynthesis